MIQPYLKKWVCVLTLSAYAWTSFSPMSSYAGQTAFNPPVSQTFELPNTMGRIVETFDGTNSGKVIIIQDAHAVPAAQIKIAEIIRFLNQNYGIRRIAVEGASEDLNGTLLRAFPDQPVLKSLLNSYLRQGYISGAVWEMIFGSKDLQFKGVEDWPLYEEGIRLYLKASQSSRTVHENNAFQERVASQIKTVLTPERQKIWEAGRRLLKGEGDFFESFRRLSQTQVPPKESVLGKLYAEMTEKNPSETAFEAELKSAADRVVQSKIDSASLSQLNGKRQALQTGQIPVSSFGLFLEGLAKTLSIPLTLSPELSRWLDDRRSLTEIRGRQFAQELNDYVWRVLSAPLEKDTERKLLDDFRRAILLNQWTVLELSVDQWKTLEPAAEKQPVWNFHSDFYRNAVKREDALFKNLKTWMAGASNEPAVIFVAGGFHAEGMTVKLKEAGVSYAVILPRIDEVPEFVNYREQMRGDVPWKNDFRVNQEEIGIYDAFIRHMRDRLLQGKSEKISETLKLWRDELIRTISDPVFLRSAVSYIDEKTAAAPPKPHQKSIEQFIRRLSDLDESNRLTPENVLPLLQGASALQWASGTALMQPGSRIRLDEVPSLIRQESRGEDLEDDQAHADVNRLRAIQHRANSNREEAQKILERSQMLADTDFSIFYWQNVNQMKSVFMGDEAFDGHSLAHQMLRLYESVRLLMQGGESPEVRISNPLIPDSTGQAIPQNYTEILVTVPGSVHVSDKIGEVLKKSGLEIKRSLNSHLEFGAKGSENRVTLMLFHVTKNDQPLSGPFSVLNLRISRALEMKMNSQAEQSFKGTSSNGYGIIEGNAAFFTGFSGGLRDVVYDIYGGLDPMLSPSDRAKAMLKIRQEDVEMFEETIDRILVELQALPGTYQLEAPSGRKKQDEAEMLLINEKIRQFVLGLEAELRKRLIEMQPKNGEMVHRPSSLSLFLEMMQERQRSYQARKLPMPVFEEIQKRLVTVLHSRFHIVSTFQTEQGQRVAIQTELQLFDQKLEETLSFLLHKSDHLASAVHYLKVSGGLIDVIKEKINRESYSAAEAIMKVIPPYVQQMRERAEQEADDTLREKKKLDGKDIELIFTNVYQLLRGKEVIREESVRGKTDAPMVIFARDMNLFDLISLADEFPGIKMIIVDKGTLAAHWALVAKDDFNIPVMILEDGMMDEIWKSVPIGTPMIINAGQKVFWTHPTDETLKILEKDSDLSEAIAEVARQAAHRPAVTRSGRRIFVRGSANLPEQVGLAVKNGADRMGLVRSEEIMMAHSAVIMAYFENPTPENRQAVILSLEASFQEMLSYIPEGESIDIRTFDEEPDKTLGFQGETAVYGPDYYRTKQGKDLLLIELAAILRANGASKTGQFRVFFPTYHSPQRLIQYLNQKRGSETKVRKNLVDLTEGERAFLNKWAKNDVRYLAALFKQTQRKLAEDFPHYAERIKATPKGYMIETLELWLLLKYVLTYADFVSFGSSDLLVHLFRDVPNPVKKGEFGISRQNEDDQKFISQLQPRFLEAMRQAFKIVSEHNAETTGPKVRVNICGVMAGNDGILGFLEHEMPSNVDVGISRAPKEIAAAKEFVRYIEPGDTAFFGRMHDAGFDFQAAVEQFIETVNARIEQSREVQEQLTVIRQKWQDMIRKSSIPVSDGQISPMMAKRFERLRREKQSEAFQEVRMYELQYKYHLITTGFIFKLARDPQYADLKIMFLLSSGNEMDPRDLTQASIGIAQGSRVAVSLEAPKGKEALAQAFFQKLESFEDPDLEGVFVFKRSEKREKAMSADLDRSEFRGLSPFEVLAMQYSRDREKAKRVLANTLEMITGKRKAALKDAEAVVDSIDRVGLSEFFAMLPSVDFGEPLSHAEPLSEPVFSISREQANNALLKFSEMLSVLKEKRVLAIDAREGERALSEALRQERMYSLIGFLVASKEMKGKIDLKGFNHQFMELANYRKGAVWTNAESVPVLTGRADTPIAKGMFHVLFDGKGETNAGPFFEVVSQVARMTAGLLTADLLKNAGELKNPERRKQIQAELLSKFFNEQTDTFFVEFDANGNVKVNLDKLVAFIRAEYRAAQAIARAA